MDAKHSSKVERSSLDTITALPQSIIETILCLIPIEQAARTSILAREWRYKWTTIPKLVFHGTSALTRAGNNFYSDWYKLSELERESRKKEIRCQVFNAINQVLLLHQGSIHEFTLYMNADETCFEIDQIILHLSRNHVVKTLTISLDASSSYNLPLSAFSLRHLTDLSLAFCAIYHEPIFSGFSSLTSLTLRNVVISKKTLLHLLSNSPSLKSLCLFILDAQFLGPDYPSIIELLKYLPMIEHLTTWGYIIPLLVQSAVPHEVPTSLVNLKYLCIEALGFSDAHGLTFLGVLMKCSPKLKKIELVINTDDGYEELDSAILEEYSTILQKYSDVLLEYLNELEIDNFRNFNIELDFVKFILARSPNLKKVLLHTCMPDKDEELKMLKILLSAPRASPVKIIVENRFEESEDDDYYLT